ncbi:hypothetical protein EST38_g8479 [Candolleomyces aberdarensis]|uniref:Protein kinase domain-containing protein n=1 Tax=Candolleomyces aberdarensis TaxID=2316362 RepID=A0A4Q2DCC5_9AGAR|nr:hypothetical protein EST38_g8479 [Candolleomyces aberdarensis]
MVCLTTIIKSVSRQVSGSLASGHTVVPSCSQSEAAAKLLDSAKITVNRWQKYPDVPSTFLEYEWEDVNFNRLENCSLASRIAPCDLSEASFASKIILPMLCTFFEALNDMFKPQLKNHNIVPEVQIRNNSRSVTDISFSSSERDEAGLGPGDFMWRRIDGKSQANLEIKPPLSAESKELNEGLESLIAQRLKSGSSSGAAKLLGQVFELANETDLRFCLLVAAPLVMRPAYLERPIGGQACRAFLGDNLMGFPEEGHCDHWPPPVCSLSLTKTIIAFISPIACRSVITYPQRWSRCTHALLPPDSIYYREYTTVCLYPKWRFVVKYSFQRNAFGAELQALQRLSPLQHTPTLIAAGSTSPSATPTQFIVTSYHGEPLKAFNRASASFICKQIVKPMHSMGFHHHDIKPDNATQDSDGNYYLIDFNTAVPSAECFGHCPDEQFLESWGFTDVVR